MANLFPGFRTQRVTGNGAEIHLRIGGEAVDAGHFAQEGNPEAVLRAFMPFYR